MTGATGVMGSETLREFSRHLDRFDVRLLVRPGKRNRRKLAPYLDTPGISVTWGDMMNPGDVKRAMGGASHVLHIGGVVSPFADHHPELAMKVNIGSMKIIIDAVKARPDSDDVRVVSIGSVAMTSDRMPPRHWGRTGDPVHAAEFDYYGLSKIKAELLLAESGLKRWVSLRQSGILHKGMIFKGSDPISFHVPLRGVLEWTTVEDSARLMVAICGDDVPESFWRGFYNIGSGPEFRMTNYRFEQLLLQALKCPPPEKIFEPSWFATRNFHGQWFEDSDKLEEMFHFREKITAGEYFRRMAEGMPWWMSLTPLAPAWLIKMAMKRVAQHKTLGTLHWLSHHTPYDAARVAAFFGSRAEQSAIPGWNDLDLSDPSATPRRLYHGYCEDKPLGHIGINDLREAACFRGGLLISDSMTTGDLDTPLEWECARDHRFTMTPRSVLLGGHWCPECHPAPWRDDEEARINPFFALFYAHR